MEKWTAAKSNDLYAIDSWGDGYFRINESGNVEVCPAGNGLSIDLHHLINSLVQRGVEVPILVRFDGIIRSRVRRLFDAFYSAIKDHDYKGDYLGVYPIKVNQQRHVVEELSAAGKDLKLGLEVGSKPELVAVIAIHNNPDGLLLCNGYKDNEYIELALLSRKLGRRTIIIVEQLSELKRILKLSESLGIEPEIGLRMKPSNKGSGRWESSSGEKAKFGLNPAEIITAVEQLKEQNKTHLIKLLHFHIGSQITSITSIKRVLREATRMYTELHKLCPELSFFDVGGGLGVDYDGSRTNFESSMNYTLEEYARDIVDAIGQACQAEGIPHPNIISESGRAMVAHHAVLVTEVTETAAAPDGTAKISPPVSDHRLLEQIYNMHSEASVKNCQETLNDAIALRDDILQGFIQGDLSLVERAYANNVYWQLIAKLKSLSANLKYIPEDLERLDEALIDNYFCNFSVFQSVPDSWAINHLFPVMPIHQLTEEPTRRAILADISCDSDGKLDRFIDLKSVRRFLKVHELKNSSPYYLGIFLVGAYQEILGDLHNLLGDTNAVHIDLDQDGQVKVKQLIEGDTVNEVLSYVQYNSQQLVEQLRLSTESALESGKISPSEAAGLQKRYKQALEGYTYLCVEE